MRHSRCPKFKLTFRRKLEIELDSIKREGVAGTLRYWYWGFTGACRAFWEHDQCQGHGIGIGELEQSSGKLEIPFGVDGHEGTAFISKDFWLMMGERAGWTAPTIDSEED